MACCELSPENLRDFEDGTILFEGLFGCDHSKPPMPERMLISAILENAIRDSLRIPGWEFSAARRQALQWMHISVPLTKEDLKDPPPFSFVWVVEALGFNAVWIRDKIKKALDEGSVIKLEKRRIR